MKVGVWVKEGIEISRGGAFSYQSKLIELIDNYVFSNDIEVCFVASDPNFQAKRDVILINDVFVERSKDDYWLFLVLKRIPLVSSILRKFNKRAVTKKIVDVKNNLYRNKVEVLYYLMQSGRMVPSYPFISTNWDVGHLSTQMFPEFLESITRNNRFSWYTNGIHESLAVFAESEAGRKELIEYTGINPSKVMVVPMIAGDIINMKIDDFSQRQILKKCGLQTLKFFIYPAQFWPHKNHINLLKAFKELRKSNPNISLVLTGSDKGNLNYVERFIAQENITGVINLGFVVLEELFTFYKNALGLVMPTMLGPTNMPPLEALNLDCPVICSNFEGHREQLGECAIYVNPLDSNEIFRAMDKLLNLEYRRELLHKANQFKSKTRFTHQNAMRMLDENFKLISRYRKNWGVEY